eukprot:GCRY01004198.1.p1 GENE.GCRY01004198.1~~GCRY01004198.1.p1  ORF type:complete len:238 (+),score=46.23 GCRY01004198.1:212-925(+)
MHGVKRVEEDEETRKIRQEIEKKKIKDYQKHRAKVEELINSKEYTKAALIELSELLLINADLNLGWNFRKDVITHMLADDTPTHFTEEEKEELLKQELKFLEQAITLNPKSYCVWYHRRWVLDRMQAPDWARELKLCAKLLDLDQRNFHCWALRRFCVAKSGVASAAELDYTLEKINQNFSNYSAWHYRSQLLPAVASLDGGSVTAERCVCLTCICMCATLDSADIFVFCVIPLQCC